MTHPQHADAEARPAAQAPSPSLNGWGFSFRRGRCPNRIFAAIKSRGTNR